MTITPMTCDKLPLLSISKLSVDSHKDDDLSLLFLDIPKERVGVFQSFFQNNWLDEKGLLTSLGAQTLPNELQALVENRPTFIEKYISLETVKRSFSTLINEKVEYLENCNPQSLIDNLLGIIRPGSLLLSKKPWETYHLLLTLGYRINDVKVIEEIEHFLDLSVAQIKHSKDKIHFLLTNFQTWCDSITALSPVQKKILLMNAAFQIQKRYAQNAHDFKLFNKIFSFSDISKESCPGLIQALEKISPFFSTYYISSFLDLFGVIGTLLKQETLSTQYLGNKRLYTLAVKNEIESPVYFYWESKNLQASLEILSRLECPAKLSPTEFTDLLFPLFNLFIGQDTLINKDAKTLKNIEECNFLFCSLATSDHYLIKFCGLFALALSESSSYETLLLEAPKFFCIFDNNSLKILLSQGIANVYGSLPVLKTPSEFYLEWGRFLMNLAHHDLKFSSVLCAYLKNPHFSPLESLFDSLPSLINTSSSLARDLLPVCKMKLDKDKYVNLLIKALAVFKEKRTLSPLDELFRDTLVLELQEILPDALTRIPELKEDPQSIWCAEIVLSKRFVEIEKKELPIDRFEKSWKILTVLFEKSVRNCEDKFFLLMDFLSKGNALPSFLNKNLDIAPWLHLISLTTKTFPNPSQKEGMIALLCSSIDSPKKWERFSRDDNNPSSEQWREFFTLLFDATNDPLLLEKFLTSLIKLPFYLENSFSTAKKGIKILDLSTPSEKKKYPFTYVIQSGWMDHQELQSDILKRVFNLIAQSKGEENSASYEERFIYAEQIFSRLHEKKLSMCPTLLSSLEESIFKLIQNHPDISVKLKWFEKYLGYSSDPSSYFKEKHLSFLLETCSHVYNQCLLNPAQHPFKLFEHSLFKALSKTQLISVGNASSKTITIAAFMRAFFLNEILRTRDEIRKKLLNTKEEFSSKEYENLAKSFWEFFNTYKEIFFFHCAKPFELLSNLAEVLAVNRMENEVCILWKWIKEKNSQEKKLEENENLHLHTLKYFVLLAYANEAQTNQKAFLSFKEIFLHPDFQPLFILQSSEDLIRTGLFSFKEVFDVLLAQKSLSKSEKQNNQLKSLFIQVIDLFDKYAKSINHIEFVKYIENETIEELNKTKDDLTFCLHKNSPISPAELKIDVQEKRIGKIEQKYKETFFLKDDIEILIIRGLINFNVFSEGFSRCLSFCESLHHMDSWTKWTEIYRDMLEIIDAIQKTKDSEIIHSYLKILDITLTQNCSSYGSEGYEFFIKRYDSFLLIFNLSKGTDFHAAFIQHGLFILWSNRYFAKSHFSKEIFDKESSLLENEFKQLDFSHQKISIQATCQFIGLWRALQLNHKALPMPMLKFLISLGRNCIENSFKANSSYKPVVFTLIYSFLLTEIEFITIEYKKNHNKKESNFYDNKELDKIIEKLINTISKLCIHSTIANKKIVKGHEFETVEVKALVHVLDGFETFLRTALTKEKERGNAYVNNFKRVFEPLLKTLKKDNLLLYTPLITFYNSFTI